VVVFHLIFLFCRSRYFVKEVKDNGPNKAPDSKSIKQQAGNKNTSKPSDRSNFRNRSELSDTGSYTDISSEDSPPKRLPPKALPRISHTKAKPTNIFSLKTTNVKGKESSSIKPKQYRANNSSYGEKLVNTVSKLPNNVRRTNTLVAKTVNQRAGAKVRRS